MIILKRRCLICCIMICLTFITVMASVITVNAKRSAVPQKILKEYGNSIALYVGRDVERVYPDIDIRNLTDYDRYLLRKGIIITNESQLAELLADYDG